MHECMFVCVSCITAECNSTSCVISKLCGGTVMTSGRCYWLVMDVIGHTCVCFSERFLATANVLSFNQTPCLVGKTCRSPVDRFPHYIIYLLKKHLLLYSLFSFKPHISIHTEGRCSSWHSEDEVTTSQTRTRRDPHDGPGFQNGDRHHSESELRPSKRSRGETAGYVSVFDPQQDASTNTVWPMYTLHICCKRVFIFVSGVLQSPGFQPSHWHSFFFVCFNCWIEPFLMIWHACSAHLFSIASGIRGELLEKHIAEMMR